MDHYSKLLMMVLFGMVCVFSLVLLFKGDLNQPALRGKIAFEPTKPVQRTPATIKEKNAIIHWQPSKKVNSELVYKQMPEAIEPEKRERFSKPDLTQEVKVVLDDIGQEIISDDIIVTFDHQTSLDQVRNLEKNYAIELKSYDSATGVAQYKIANQDSRSLVDVKEQIKRENPNIRASEYNYVLKPTESLQSASLPKEFSSSANNLWHLRNTGDDLPFDPKVPSVYDVDVSNGDVEKIWKKGSNQTYPCALIAVIDTGFDYWHPELKDRIWFNAGESGTDSAGNKKSSNGIDDDGNGYIDDYVGWSASYEDPNASIPLIKGREASHPNGAFDQILQTIQKLKNDAFASPKTSTSDDSYNKLRSFHKDLTHGIGVFGLIAAARNDNLGVGLCYSGNMMTIQHAKLALDNGDPVMVIDGLAAAKAIVYAADNHAQVINASFGQYWKDSQKSDCNKDGIGDVSAPCYILNAVEYAHSKGSILVAAAGNSGIFTDPKEKADDPESTPHYPSVLSYERPDLNVIAVGGHAADGSLWVEMEKQGDKDVLIGGSNYGKKSVTLAAPSIYLFNLAISEELEKSQFQSPYTRDNLFGNLLTRKSTDSYPTHSYASGTSGAAPLVSAGAAIIYQELLTTFKSNQNKDFTKAVKDLLVNNVRLLKDLSDENIKAGKNGISTQAMASMTDKFQVKAGAPAILDIYTALSKVGDVKIDSLPDSQSMVRPEIVADQSSSTVCGPGEVMSSDGTCSQETHGLGLLKEDSLPGTIGGCGIIDNKPPSSGSGNWPILVLYVVSFFLFLRGKRQWVIFRGPFRRRLNIHRRR